MVHCMGQFLETRVSLILRLSESDDVEAWEEFTAVYLPALYRLTNRSRAGFHGRGGCNAKGSSSGSWCGQTLADLAGSRHAYRTDVRCDHRWPYPGSGDAVYRWSHDAFKSLRVDIADLRNNVDQLERMLQSRDDAGDTR